MKSICVVTINDHNSLGGPMGSERITTAGTQPCVDRQAALRWAKAWFKKNTGSHYTPQVAAMNFQQFKKWGADMGPYGVDFEMVKVYG